MMRKYLYDENPDERLLKHPHHAYFFIVLEKILQEYWILEVVKLHDPATQRGFDNLSVDYVLKLDGWPSNTKFKLQNLKKKMNKFSSLLTEARNKLLSHKDKDVIVTGEILGVFDEGEDEVYFKFLENFASEAHENVLGEPFIFDDLIKNDIEVFMNTFASGFVSESN